MKDMNQSFQHSTQLGKDERCIELRRTLGVEGYGVFMMLLELVAESPDHTFVCDYNLIGYNIRCDASVVKKVVEDFRLFELTDDGKRFRSIDII